MDWMAKAASVFLSNLPPFRTLLPYVIPAVLNLLPPSTAKTTQHLSWIFYVNSLLIRQCPSI